jgi:hypothetical protein
MLFSLGCILDDCDFVQLFEVVLNSEEKADVCSTPHSDRKRQYISTERHEGQLLIIDQGCYQICWDRQKRAILKGIHNKTADIEKTKVGEFEGQLRAIYYP